MKSYNITRPMPWPEFKAMPEDLKREFFRNMQSEFFEAVSGGSDR